MPYAFGEKTKGLEKFFTFAWDLLLKRACRILRGNNCSGFPFRIPRPCRVRLWNLPLAEYIAGFRPLRESESFPHGFSSHRADIQVNEVKRTPRIFRKFATSMFLPFGVAEPEKRMFSRSIPAPGRRGSSAYVPRPCEIETTPAEEHSGQLSAECRSNRGQLN